ncbi:hypothetical protein D9613_001340 [Agrocybe pediades]|uniref:Uncharacterized protein n=1 Tax=Agrocybe pediades TaxID=84607 RepID=A0A8H4VUS6_9AGAR|nr:hypothetical protein D9613_001340 [Agrocybe pediades]
MPRTKQLVPNHDIGRDPWQYRDPVQSFVSTSEASFYPPPNAIGQPARLSQLSRQDTELFEDTPASTYTEENENESYPSFLASLTVKSLYKRIPEGRLFPDIRNWNSANTTAPQVKWESKWEEGTMPLLECCDCSAHTSTMSMVPGDARYHFSEDDPSLNFEIDSAMGYKGVCMLEAFYQWEIQDKDEEIPLSGRPDFLTIEMPLPGPVKQGKETDQGDAGSLYGACIHPAAHRRPKQGVSRQV